MPLRVKKTPLSRLGSFRLRNNQGQALIEYVLMLVIIVSLVLMLMTQIFKPFGDFIQSYMGSYVGCLLEYGELPSLGYPEPSEVDDDSECNKKFQAGTLNREVVRRIVTTILLQIEKIRGHLRIQTLHPPLQALQARMRALRLAMAVAI